MMVLFIKASLSQNQFSDSTLTDSVDTIIPIIEPICDEDYHNEQKEMRFFLNEIRKAFNIQMPDSLNNGN